MCSLSDIKHNSSAGREELSKSLASLVNPSMIQPRGSGGQYQARSLLQPGAMPAIGTGFSPGNQPMYARTTTPARPASRPPGPRMQLDERITVQRIPVVCNGNKGIFLVGRQVIVCLCEGCVQRAKEVGLAEMELSPTDFERHSGPCSGALFERPEVLHPVLCSLSQQCCHLIHISLPLSQTLLGCNAELRRSLREAIHNEFLHCTGRAAMPSNLGTLHN